MKPRHYDIINSSSALFNREGYLTPSIDRISEAAGISKMTFYRYFHDKESLIKCILEEKHKVFILELKSAVNLHSTVKDKLFSIFNFYQDWFAKENYHGCMFSRAVIELGNSMPSINAIVYKFKSDLYQLIRIILLDCFDTVKADRIAYVILMLIDGAISLSQTMDKENREFAPAMTAWATAKTIIAAEGGVV
ncbi:TetR/AcrR family transcriptional regulator [Klebsiella michiganensis]|uniref:TetR/AcrR family transcriptional regulator n=1 Tax=Klebsiella michiganensis TaxID=1134687 RepID=A0A6P1V0Y9_9ENTR|nr:TetR/AcrR family transcriptional regulator [Klebsiella michiganensis]MXJ81331.1 TetR family transcriptional regulator [Klebsiella michiganensis]QHS46666.1 TetR/AcrR family transcriptional regulator [Klebsiella michiganensis]